MNVRLLVLGLLEQQPMHGYEMRRLAAQSRIESWSGVLPGSIYHALKGLERDGLIAPARDPDAEASRSRAVYSITLAGRRALTDLVREALAQPIRSFPTDLYGGLLYLRALPDAEVRTALMAQLQAIGKEIADWESARAKKGTMSHEMRALFDSATGFLEVNKRLIQRLLHGDGKGKPPRGTKRQGAARGPGRVPSPS
jgi:DNA-binding PadR family transcriptional regulator